MEQKPRARKATEDVVHGGLEDIRGCRTAMKRAEDALDRAVTDLEHAVADLYAWKTAHPLYSGKEDAFHVRTSQVKEADERLEKANEHLEKASERLNEAHHVQLLELVQARKRTKLQSTPSATARDTPWPDEPAWKWKTQVEPVDSLLHVAYQDRAVAQLQDLHNGNYARAVNYAGRDWAIPMADNATGLGNSLFGDQYIHRCRGAWKDVVDGQKTNFQKTISACHTVHLVFARGELLSEQSLDAVMTGLLVQKLHEQFDKPPWSSAIHQRPRKHF